MSGGTRVRVERDDLPYEIYGFVRGNRYESYFEFRHPRAFHDKDFIAGVYSLLNDTDISGIECEEEGVYIVNIYGNSNSVLALAADLYAAIELICEDQNTLVVDFFIKGLLKLPRIVEPWIDFTREAVVDVFASRREEFANFLKYRIY